MNNDSRKFASFVWANGTTDEYVYYSVAVPPHSTVTETRNSVVRQSTPSGMPPCSRLAGIVRACSSEFTSHLDWFEFVFCIEGAPPKPPVDASPPTTHSVRDFVLARFESDTLSYHELRLSSDSDRPEVDLLDNRRSCVVIGSYRKHLAALQGARDAFEDFDIVVLAPRPGSALNPDDAFVVLDYDSPALTEGELQAVILKKMDRADFTYLANPEGYIGKSAAFEIGYNFSRGNRVYASHKVDEMHDSFIAGVAEPRAIASMLSDDVAVIG